MKKKLTLFLFVSLFITFSSYAQKNIDIDNLKFKATIKVSPWKALNPVFFYYSTKIDASTLVKNSISLEDLEKSLVIQSQRKTTDISKAAINLEVTLGTFEIFEVNVREKNMKNLKGESSTRYSLEINYDMPRSYRIMKGNEVLNEYIVPEKRRSSASSQSSADYTHNTNFDSRREAMDYWSANSQILSTRFIKGLASDIVNSASEAATRNYGFTVLTFNENLITMDEKKHPENEMFQSMTNTLKKELEGMTPEKGADHLKIDTVIEYYKGVIQKYTDPSLKADKKLRYASYYNLCKAYIYLDEPEKVEEYANLLIANDYDPKDGEKLKKEATSVLENLNRTAVHKRHFNPDDYFDQAKM